MSTGRIARTFIAAVQQARDTSVTAVASRDAERAQTTAREFNIPHAHATYEALIADPEVDAIYIGTPNTLHAEWAIAAAQAGKHVLCEKPLGATAAEAAAMFAAARNAGVLLMEAFMYRFHPRTIKLHELITSGAIGQVRLVRAAFGFTVTDPANIRLSAELAGGSLMDVGCYCVNFARMVAGTAPTHVDTHVTWAASGVDESLAAQLSYPNGVVAQIASSLASARHHAAQIIGSDGIIEVDEAFVPSPERPTQLRIRRNANDMQEETFTFDPVNQYRVEAETFARLIGAPDVAEQGMPQRETLDNMATIDALLSSAREGSRTAVRHA